MTHALRIICALFPALAFATDAPAWRDLEPATRTGILLAALHDLAHEGTPEARPTERTSVDARLLYGLAALAEDAAGVTQRYQRRLTVVERLQLRARLPGVVARLTQPEPYLRIELHRQRRALDPRLKRRPLGHVVRDYYQIARKMLRRPVTFAILDSAQARTEAELILKIEAMVNDQAEAAGGVTTPADEIMDALLDAHPATTSPTLARFLKSRLDQIENLDEFERTYRERLTVDQRARLGANARSWTALLQTQEPAAVAATLETLREQRLALTPEMKLVRGLTTEILKTLSGFLVGEQTARARFDESERTTERALRLLRFERILLRGKEPTCNDHLARVIRGRSKDPKP